MENTNPYEKHKKTCLYHEFAEIFDNLKKRQPSTFNKVQDSSFFMNNTERTTNQNTKSQTKQKQNQNNLPLANSESS